MKTNPRRDARGRFLPGRRVPKPWIVAAVDKHVLGGEVRAASRRAGCVTSLGHHNQARFATEAGAARYAAGLPAHPRWRFVVAKL